MAHAAQGSAATGREAERRAREHLQAQGLRHLLSNFHARGGELDLVMREDDTLVIVEVRARRPGAQVAPEASVTGRKLRRIIAATEALLLAHPAWRNRPLRFDLVAIDTGGELRWHRAAFTADDAV